MDLTNALKIPDHWKANLGKQLNNPTLVPKNTPLSFSKEVKKNIGIFALSFNVDASGKITMFNTKNDTDDLKNYTSPPLTLIGSDKAMLRYDFDTQLKEVVSGAFKKINLNFKAEQKILISYYKIHTNTDQLQKALFQDFASLKSIYNNEDILSLAINEGLAVKFKGTLDAGLSLAFSDVFSETLSQLLTFIPVGTNIAAITNVGASLACSVKISDEFKVFIQKTKADQYCININKALSKTGSASVKAGITASLDETQASFQTFINQLLSALLNQSVDTVTLWVKKGLANLNDTDKNLLSAVIKRIGLDVDLTDENLVQTQYENFKSKIIDKAKAIIGKKLELGVGYEYQQLNAEHTLFNANLTENAVKENLKTILLFKPDELEGKPGVIVTNYLFSKTVSITQKFGFQLQFGKFEAHWFNEKEFNFEDIQNKVKNTRQIVFSGQRSHSEGGRNQKEWHLNLTGKTDEAIKDPKMSDFTFATILHWEDQERKTNTDELADFVEMGMKWKCIDTPFEETCSKIHEQIKGKTNVKFSCEINVSAPETTKLIPLLAQPSTNIIEQILCEAMPHYSNTHRKMLANLVIYNGLWKAYIKAEGKGTSEQWATHCYNQLNFHYSDLAEWERSFEQGTTTISGQQSYQSFVGLIENNNLAKAIERLLYGMKQLNNAIQKQKPYSENLIKKVFNKIDDMVTSSGQNKTFNITFLGCYLISVAKQNDLSENISAKMTIDYKNEQNENKQIIFMMI